MKPNTPKNSQILLVDDEALVLEELTETFEFEGFEVTTAATGDEAAALPGIDEMDIVISDLKMPGLSGLDLFKLLKQRGDFNGSVILLSGHGAQVEHDEAIELGIYAFLSKPIDVVDLVTVVENAIEGVCSQLVQ
jgi:YesN/AraC family two-component response regulator